jgi:hypothetical protein
LDRDILNLLVELCGQLVRGEYMRANDAYLRMAIGNAPWPIGVTNVGIHSRTGREKIFAQNIAHVLNDETQRKYIQALKRLMTYCQLRFPSDPSKCLEYHVRGRAGRRGVFFFVFFLLVLIFLDWAQGVQNDALYFNPETQPPKDDGTA